MLTTQHFYHFANFLDELDKIESGKRKLWDVIDVPTEDDPQEVTNQDIKISLEDVLFFLTGSRYLLAKGLRKGEVTFSHDSCRRVHVNACALGIVFPFNERYTGPNFSENFCEDVLSSPGFGKV